jgi:hypothetical protein
MKKAFSVYQPNVSTEQETKKYEGPDTIEGIRNEIGKALRLLTGVLQFWYTK